MPKKIKKKIKKVVAKTKLPMSIRKRVATPSKSPRELLILYDLSNAIFSTTDEDKLMDVTMESLKRMVDYDLSGTILLKDGSASVVLKTLHNECCKFLDDIKERLISRASELTGENVGEKNIVVRKESFDLGKKVKRVKEIKEKGLISIFRVPFIVLGNAIGVLIVASCKKKAFTNEEIRFMYIVVNQVSQAIERLRIMLANEQSKMLSMVESMTEGVIFTDSSREIIVINPAASMMLGLARMKSISLRDIEKKFYEIDMDDIVIRRMKFESEEEGDISRQVTFKDLALQIFQEAVCDREGKKIGFVTFLKDITEQKKLERLKDEFISSVSHELRTPLTTIKNVVSNALAGITGEISESLKTYLHMANSEIDRLTRIINDLLDISKIESGKFELRRDFVDISKLLDCVVKVFADFALKKGVELKKSYVGVKKLPIYIDPDRITQVVFNLVDNAIKFTPTGGSVSINIEDLKNEIEVRVSDTGMGISPEGANIVFEKFRQVGRIEGSGIKGTGLGLAIARELIEMHGGKIWLSSELGKGSVFGFRLPKISSKEVAKIKAEKS
ncbi:MAG: ATP-binding protein [Pseudomonadota bacterium]